MWFNHMWFKRVYLTHGFRGKIVKRPETNINPHMSTGEVELEVESIECMVPSATQLPFYPSKTKHIDANEQVESGMRDTLSVYFACCRKFSHHWSIFCSVPSWSSCNLSFHNLVTGFLRVSCGTIEKQGNFQLAKSPSLVKSQQTKFASVTIPVKRAAEDEASVPRPPEAPDAEQHQVQVQACGGHPSLSHRQRVPGHRDANSVPENAG